MVRLAPTERQRLMALTILSGGFCGLAAVAFHVGIVKASALMINRAMAAPGHWWIPLTILTPTLGGLLAGLGVCYWAPGAVGSGIPQVKYAYARSAGKVTLRDAFAKFVLAVLQIGSGASLGREGPTVQICAGVSSLLGRWGRLSTQNRRRMASVGVAAGIAAAFNAPIAAVTFTLEEVIGDLDQTMLSGVIVAAALAAVVERTILGTHPVLEVTRTYSLRSASSLVWYAVLGGLSAVVSIAFTDSLLNLRDWFKRLQKVPKWAHPAIGGAVTGALAVVGLAWLHSGGVTGGGYVTLGWALLGTLPIKVLIGLCVLKLVATVFSYGSGGVGGIFAPALFIGAMLGGAIGYIDVAVFHHPADEVGAFAVVGMGAVFAGIIRAPMTSVLIIFEMTGGYGLILPLMVANMSAYALARHWRRTPIYEALLLQDGVELPHGKPVVDQPPEVAAEVQP
ncbi:MAG TPA: chloride channel protein [Candidatus Angelobacter sp.]|nr:chloride channel protein [Candidatus Angelobacter sp.]